MPLSIRAALATDLEALLPHVQTFWRFEKLPFMGSSPPEGRFEAGPGS